LAPLSSAQFLSTGAGIGTVTAVVVVIVLACAVLAWLYVRRWRQKGKSPSFLSDSEKYGSIVEPISGGDHSASALQSSIVELDLDPGRTSMPTGPMAPPWTHEESLQLEHNASSFLESDPNFGRHGVSVASDGYGADHDTDRETMTTVRDTQASASSDSLRGSLVALPDTISTTGPRPPTMPAPTLQQRLWLRKEEVKVRSPAIEPSEGDSTRQNTTTRQAIVNARVMQAQAQELASAADALAAAEAQGERASHRNRLKERVARATNAIVSMGTKK